MTNDFGDDFAEDIAAVFSAATDITAPASVWLTLYDDTGTELDGSLQNGRVQVTVPGGINQGADATQLENANEVDFGEASGDITVQDFGVKSADDTDANATVFFKGPVQNSPQDFAVNTRVFYDPADLNVNVLDYTND